MKEGAIVEEIDLSTRSFYLIGREQDLCHIFLENPTISRKHAIIQHKDTGDIFVYDLGSTHGTFLNKHPVPANEYVKLKPGDMLRFGQSTRWLILNNPEQEEPEEEQEHKRIRVVSKRENEELIRKNRMEQITRMS